MSILPQISIVVPVYNGNKYLKQTVQSIIHQSLKSFEIVIINDGSTDNTEEIALHLQNTDNRIFYAVISNAGVSASRNLGLGTARGEFIVFFDADDMMAPDFLQSRVDFLLENPTIGACGSVVKLIDGDGNLIHGVSDMQAPGESMPNDVLLYQANVTTVPSNLMYRRKLLIENRIFFDLRLSSSADRLFLCKLALVAKFHCISDSNFYYRLHPMSMYNDPKRKRAVFEDNALFVKILIDEDIVPKNLKGVFLKRNYYMLAGAAWHAKLLIRSVLYGIKYFIIKIKYFD